MMEKEINFEGKLWQTADKLRNNMDAAEYKHVVLGMSEWDDGKRKRLDKREIKEQINFWLCYFAEGISASTKVSS